MTLIADLNVTQQLRPGPNDYVVANARCATPATQVTQCDAMIEGAMLPNTRLRMHDNATEVMNAQAFSNPSLCWQRDTRRDLCEALDKEAKWLGWDTVLVTPAKDTVHEKCLEPLGQHSPHDGTQTWPLLTEAGQVCTHNGPE
jgi:hypothetical protein